MSNQKKILMAVAVAVLGLSSCGRENYNGTYTGYQMAAQTTGTSSYYNYSMAGNSAVTASLTSNGDSVTGTYQLTGGSSYYNTSTSYQLTANSSQSGQLTAVTLIPTSNMYNNTGCGFLTGTLTTSNKGQMITGTLTPSGAAAYSGAQSSMCPSVQISLTRNN